MVAPGAASKIETTASYEFELRRCIRDLVAISSLPALWIRADRNQIAQSLAELTVSILDVDCACVFLDDPSAQIVRFHDRGEQPELDVIGLRAQCRNNHKSEVRDQMEINVLRSACLWVARPDRH